MWQEVARGANIWDLAATIADMELPKGTRIKVVMDLKVPVGGLFNTGVGDWLGQRFVPNGTDFIDAYGEGSQGIIELESDPVWLIALLAFIKAHWVALMIAGFLLAAIIATIVILVKIAVAPTLPIATIAIVGGLALLGIILVRRQT